MYDLGLIDVGTGTFRLNDNDVIGTSERQNANAWTLRAHGNTTSISGVERKLNYHTHCSWVDPEADVNCNWQVNYH